MEIHELLGFNLINLTCNYSHLSNKREVTLTDFEKFHPPKKNPPSTIALFLNDTKSV